LTRGPKPPWWHTLQTSKNEAVLAIDLYNRSGKERQLEAFIVHMSLAWLRLMQAKTERDSGERSLYSLDKRGHRQRAKDGDWVMKPLSALTDEVLTTPNDPVKANLEFFTSLRHKVEHRHARHIAALVAGKTQAHLLNYENTLVAWFGTDESVAHELRFPLFVSSITGDAVDALKAVAKRVPKGLREWIRDYDSALDPQVAQAQAYDFRVYLIPHTGPKSTADAAMTFVNPDDLDDRQKATVEQVQTIIRDRQVPVSNLDKLVASDVAKRVSAGLGVEFGVHKHHTKAWKHYKIRPATSATDQTKTRADFCVYDATFRQHVYTQSWVEYLIRKLADPVEFEKATGHPPVRTMR
jgi:hypothetical protein